MNGNCSKSKPSLYYVVCDSEDTNGKRERGKEERGRERKGRECGLF